MSRPDEHVLHNLGTPIINIKTKISLVGPRYKIWLCIKMKLKKSQNHQNTYLTRLGYFYAKAILSWGWVEVEAEVNLSLKLKWGWDEIKLKFSWS